MKQRTSFAPVLAIPNGTTDIEFYTSGLGAVEQWCLRNDDGSIHVAELAIDDMYFHVHEMTPQGRNVTPDIAGGCTTSIGLFTYDVHTLFNRAIAAGGVQVSPVTDHEYGYRQGEFYDPFGHRWIIQCRIPAAPGWLA